MAHARILRWAAAVAEAGDDYAAAVLELDDERLRLASRKMAGTLDLYVLASEAGAERSDGRGMSDRPHAEVGAAAS